MPKEITIIILLITALALMVLIFCIILTFLTKNKEIRLLRISTKINERDEKYANELLELLKIKTKAFSVNDNGCPFLDKIDVFFPLIKEKMKIQKYGSHLILTYSPPKQTKNILFFVNRGDEEDGNPYLSDYEIHGAGSYGKKAILYASLQALEETFKEKKDINVGITFVATIKQTIAEKDGEFIANQFLKKRHLF